MKSLVLTLAAIALAASPAFAQSKKYKDIKADTAKVHYIHREKPEDAYIYASNERKNTVFVNEQVTTHIIMPENIKLVDISTNAIIGNQCADNIVRIKPAGRMYDHELAGTMTVIGERHIAQFNVVYVKGPAKANSIYNINIQDTKRYENPDVSMPEYSMAQYAWSICSMPAHYHNVKFKKYGIKGVVNNIYSIGDYFFIDFSLYNNTKIKYDVSEIRVKLTDKKETKATNSQTIELTPVFMLSQKKSFIKGYRNVIVLDKLTFPDEKVLTIEVSENQISGRVLYIPIEYNDILNADGFDERLMKSLSTGSYPYYKNSNGYSVQSDYAEYQKLQEDLQDANKELKATIAKKDSLTNEISILEGLRDQLQNVKMELSDTQAKKDALEKELSGLGQKQQSLSQLNTEISSKEAYLKKLNDKIDSLRKILNNVDDIKDD